MLGRNNEKYHCKKFKFLVLKMIISKVPFLPHLLVRYNIENLCHHPRIVILMPCNI